MSKDLIIEEYTNINPHSIEKQRKRQEEEFNRQKRLVSKRIKAYMSINGYDKGYKSMYEYHKMIYGL